MAIIELCKVLARCFLKEIDLMKLTFVTKYNEKEISRTAAVPSETDKEFSSLHAFVRSLFYDIPDQPAILSLEVDGEQVFLPLATSSLPSIGDGGKVTVHFRGLLHFSISYTFA